MRILFLSDNFPPEGNAPAARVHAHARHWVTQGHQVTVITCAPNFPEGRLYPGYRNDWSHEEDMDGIRVVRVKTYMAPNAGVIRRTLDYMSFMVTGFAAGLYEPRPDVVVATSPQFFCALGGWMLAAARRVPFVFELRDLWPASIAAVGAIRRRRLIRWIERLELFLYRRAAAVVPVTQAFADDLVRRGILRGKIHVIRNGADLSLHGPRPRDAGIEAQFDLSGRFVAGYLGTFGMAHGLAAVVAAAERLRARRDVVFMLAGAGAERERIEREVADRGLTNVRLVPRQPKERVGGLWSVCDVAIVPLRDHPVFATTVPSKIYEALACGVPVVAALPEGEATRLVRESGGGLVVGPEDPEALARTVGGLADDPPRLASLREKGLAWVRQHSRERQAERMAEVLAGLVRRRSRGPDS